MAVLRDLPYGEFNFLVDLGTGNTDGPEAGFQECSRIGMEVAVAEYRNGNEKENSVRKITGLTKVSDVTLRRGIIGSLGLYQWLSDVRNGSEARRTDVGARLEAVQALRHMSPVEASRVIRVYRLTREMVPTELLVHPVVWDALLESMPLGALVRNLGVMSRVGLLAAGSEASRVVAGRLGDGDAIRRARLHPMAVLAASLGNTEAICARHYAHLAPGYVADTIRLHAGGMGIVSTETHVVPLRQVG